MLILDTYVQFEETIILNKRKQGVIFSEALKVTSGVLKVMTLKNTGILEKRLYFNVI